MDEQWATVSQGTMTVQLRLPSVDAQVVPGVRWGRVETSFTPAYWAYQVMARRIEHRTIQNRLGSSLREEVGACLLGGHGIPAAVGLAAFQRLRSRGVFLPDVTMDAATIRELLAEPLNVAARPVRYRFASQKAHYLAEALRRLTVDPLTALAGRALRDALMTFPGVGYKTASWITRNWDGSDDVAILDIHVLRAGMLAGFFDPALSVERHYRQLEDQFLAFSQGLGVRASELDAVIWTDMMQSPRSVAFALEQLPHSPLRAKQGLTKAPTQHRRANADQLSLLS